MIKPRPAQPGEVNYSAVDRFTLVHFSIGVLYAFMHLPFGAVAFLAIFWEIIENPLKVWFPKLFPHASADTLRNSIGDIVAVIAGWYVFYYNFRV